MYCHCMHRWLFLSLQIPTILMFTNVSSGLWGLFCAGSSACCYSCIVPVSCNMSAPINSQVMLLMHQLNMAKKKHSWFSARWKLRCKGSTRILYESLLKGSPCKGEWISQCAESCSATTWLVLCSMGAEESSPCKVATGCQCECQTVLN